MNRSVIDAAYGGETEHTPVWFMRQAGRYLPAYVKVRKEMGILDMMDDPGLASEVTVKAAEELGVDAAIVFADITSPLIATGVKIRIEGGVGPIVESRLDESLEKLRRFDVEGDMPNFVEGIRMAVEKLNDRLPLIGFSGAPFTLSTYLVEGKYRRDSPSTKLFMYTHEMEWEDLQNKLSSMVVDYLKAQVKHGVSVVQVFDSWAGTLSREDFRRYAKPYLSHIFSSLPAGVPRIYFCTSSLHLLDELMDIGADVLSVDWRTPLECLWRDGGERIGVQGNLDPAAALSGGKLMESKVSEITRKAHGHRRFIFNMGHGVLPGTSVDNLKRIVRMVHEVK